MEDLVLVLVLVVLSELCKKGDEGVDVVLGSSLSDVFSSSGSFSNDSVE